MLKWMKRRKGVSLPAVSFQEAANFYKSFTSPNPDINAVVLDAAGHKVGRVTYAVSPLEDRLYLFQISIDQPSRRRGFGLAALVHIAQRYRLPIVPVKELYSPFWSAARELKATDLQILGQLSVGDMDNEAERWSHLQPEIERLNQLITDRLSLHREPWDVAVGRGLPPARTA